MLLFIGLSILILIAVAIYIRKGKRLNNYNKPIYENTYLKEYLELQPETDPLDQYKILIKASKYLIEKEEEIEKECKLIYSLFCARMISSTLWEQYKNAKEEVNMDKITVDAELGRFKKIDKSKIERVRIESSSTPQRVTLSYPSSKENEKALYTKYTEGTV